MEFYCEHILYFAGLLVDNHLVIITTDANAYVKPVHSRMPVILEKEDIDPWLKDISKTKGNLIQTRHCTSKKAATRTTFLKEIL